MIRVVPGLIVIALLVAITVFFADQPGSVSMIWLGWRIDLPVAMLLLAILVLALALWAVFWLVGKALGTPRRLARARRDRQRLHGYRLLTDGLVALAVGDATTANKAGLRAELLFRKSRFDEPPLTRLLAAQSALMRGDETAAKLEFSAMAEHAETELLGIRGLIVQALKDGDDTEALALTERAKRLMPGAPWVLQSRMALETRASDWPAATTTLKDAVKRGVVTPERGRHYRAALLVEQSRQAASLGQTRGALSYAAQAHGLEQAFAPVAIHYARLLRDADKLAKGLGVLERAWQQDGHPAVAEAYGLLLATEAAPARLKRIERLVALRPAEAEGHMAAAAVAISARLWGEARRHLERAGSDGTGPWPKRLCQLMAALEQSERNDTAAAHLWLDRHQHAPDEPCWICASCGAERAVWEALCPTCHSFDTLAWRIPDRSARRLDPAQGLPPADAATLTLYPSPS
ncbi:MAG: heme biosynthesis HemY N-terminal domain-containing protein [Aliidongia sp.]